MIIFYFEQYYFIKTRFDLALMKTISLIWRRPAIWLEQTVRRSEANKSWSWTPNDSICVRLLDNWGIVNKIPHPIMQRNVIHCTNRGREVRAIQMHDLSIVRAGFNPVSGECFFKGYPDPFGFGGKQFFHLTKSDIWHCFVNSFDLMQPPELNADEN